MMMMMMTIIMNQVAGKTFTWWGVSSTTLRREVAESLFVGTPEQRVENGGSCLFCIDAVQH